MTNYNQRPPKPSQDRQEVLRRRLAAARENLKTSRRNARSADKDCAAFTADILAIRRELGE